jgi:hypothetical protein
MGGDIYIYIYIYIYAIIVNKSCIFTSGFHYMLKETPMMFALLLLLYRNKKKQAFKYPGQVTPAAQKIPS